MHSDPAAPPIARPLAAIEEDIRCPLCSYNLRGLTEPRCPECGFTFKWPDLFDASRRKHPYLFEHHPERNFWSFRKTLLGSQRPFRFWRSVAVTPAVVRRRVLLYWLVLAILFVIPLFAVFAWSAIEAARSNAAAVAYLESAFAKNKQDKLLGNQLARAKNSGYQSALTNFRRDLFSAGGLVVIGTPIAWPWFTILTLLPWNRARSHTLTFRDDALRAAIYSCDIMVCLPCVFLGLAGLGASKNGLALFGLPRQALSVAAVTVLAIAVAVWVLRLYAACQTYLRLERPLTAAVCSTLGSGVVSGGYIWIVIASSR